MLFVSFYRFYLFLISNFQLVSSTWGFTYINGLHYEFHVVFLLYFKIKASILLKIG